jgi:superfamily II DNA/RNA helicase
VEKEEKRSKLLLTLRSISHPPVLIFCNHHESVDELVDFLHSEQFHVAGIHGEKLQSYRFRVLQQLRDGRLDVLVSTDVLARGIDVHAIPHVIIYDMPLTLDTYIHRVGRTGRLDTYGEITAFVTKNCEYLKDFVELLQENKQQVPSELKYWVEK